MQPAPKENDEQLDALLRQWKVDEPLPPRFEEGVWQRVGREEGREAAAGRVTWWEWVRRELVRPPVALSYVSLLLLTGLAAGYWQARATEAHAERRLGSHYVQMLDPYRTGDHIP